MKNIRTLAIAATIAFGSHATFAQAEDYPTETITIINQFSVGGPSDNLGRAFASEMTETLGQPVIMESKPGTTLSGAALTQSDADGYTLLLSVSALHTILPDLIKGTEFDGLDDFDFIAQLAAVPSVLVVPANSPATDLQSFIAYAKDNSLNYGSVGVGSLLHLGTEYFNQQAGIDVVHIPYKGGAPVRQGLLSGEIDYAFLNVPAVRGLVADGKLKALALSSGARVSQMPDVPTMGEQGFDFNLASTYLLSAPHGTDPAILAKIFAAVQDAAGKESITGPLSEAGFTIDILDGATVRGNLEAEREFTLPLIEKVQLSTN